MRLFIAEKASLGRAIAEALGNQQKEPSGIRCGDDFVTWASGHILRLPMPNEIREEWLKWTLEQLPMLPEQWGKLPNEKNDGAARLKAIKPLLSQAEEVVNAGDADREGQLLIDEILEYLKYKGPVRRLLITDTTPAAVRHSIETMKDNEIYAPMRDAAMARERTDWLIGLNMSRLYSIRTNLKLGTGRVQTPTLGLIVNRDNEIADFKPIPYWQISATFVTPDGEFRALWIPNEEQAGLDESGRLIDGDIAAELVRRLSGYDAVIQSVKREKKTVHPPLPHSLPTLQIACNKRFDLTASKTLEILQGLYEAGITTYPRSDCQYLPTARAEGAPVTLHAIAEMLPELKDKIENADPALRTAAWNDKKVAEHFAVIPTGKKATLDGEQKKVFLEVAGGYLAQFSGDHTYQAMDIMLDVNGEQFKATGRQTLQLGWKAIVSGNTEEKDGELNALPEVSEGDTLPVAALAKDAKKTQPPKHFTEATLLQAMNGIHKFVSDPEIKKTLKEVDGIGTAATQAGIIEKIIARGYVEKSKKNLIATTLGKELIASISKELSAPDLTAVMEQQAKKVYDRELGLDEYMKNAESMVKKLVSDAKGADIQISANSKGGGVTCPVCKKGVMIQKKSQYGLFWTCQNPSCKAILSDEKGKPARVEPCPKCGSVMKRYKRKDGSGYYWRCTNKDCGKFADDAKGKPVKNEVCPKCGDELKRWKRKDGSGYFWHCVNKDCGLFMDDKNGKPILRAKAKKN